jgi:hypothetical protein
VRLQDSSDCEVADFGAALAKVRSGYSDADRLFIAVELEARTYAQRMRIDTIRAVYKQLASQLCADLRQRQQGGLRKRPASRRESSRRDLSRKFELLGAFLPPSIRATAWEPSRQELLEDYVDLRRRVRTPWERRYIVACVAVRAAIALADCLRVCLGDKGLGLVGRVLPAALRHWWFGGRWDKRFVSLILHGPDDRNV